MASPPLKTQIYETKLAGVTNPQFALPTTPTRSTLKESLRRRSPTRIGRTARESPNQDEYQKLLRDPTISAGNKDLASRVVEAAENLNLWCSEIERWGWSGSFETPALDSQNTHDSLLDVHEYCGSLSRAQIEIYENRLDQIGEELAALEVDEQKEHVLGIHIGRSRPSSSFSTQSRSTLHLMDVFQLFVTETMMQSLLYHAKLKHYLIAWPTRLDVLLQVPLFSKGLQNLSSEIARAYRTLQRPFGPAMSVADLLELQEELENTIQALQMMVSSLGILLDKLLDTLEGSEDRLPDQWIDRFEADEKEYSEWSFHAEKQLFSLRMLVQSKEIGESRVSPKPAEASIPRLVVVGNGESENRPAYLTGTMCQGFVGVSDQHVDSSDPSGRVESKLSDRPSSEAGNDNDDSMATTIHRPQKAIAPVMFLTTVGEDEGSDAVPEHSNTGVEGLAIISVRDSISTIASHIAPSACESSPEPSSPNICSKQPASWITPASSPQVALTTDTSIQEKPVQDGRPRITDTVNITDTLSSPTYAASSDNDSESGELPDDSPSMRTSARIIASAPKPPLNYAMRKRRGGKMSASEIVREISTPFPDLDTVLKGDSPPGSPTKGTRPPNAPTVPLQEQISSILESIPAPIRLTAGPSANAADVKPKHKYLSSSPQPRSRAATLSQSPFPQITLAPAEEATVRRAGANEPEIKIYHLSRAGQAKPIKLFVRRVGENGERVMVRVGGGWADLGEYLRGYAEHHGRRTVSEGRVEVLGLNSDSAGAHGTPNSHRTSLVSSFGSSAFAGTVMDEAKSPTPSSANNTGKEESTPSSSSSESGSRRISPATRDAGDISLAGSAHRTIKKGDMSEGKKQWVESVIEQAKASVPVRKLEFGDLGKEGGTRRVFLKGGKATEL